MKLVFITQMYRDAGSTKHKIHKNILNILKLSDTKPKYVLLKHRLASKYRTKTSS